jgi:hypothetical protein
MEVDDSQGATTIQRTINNDPTRNPATAADFQLKTHETGLKGTPS